MKKILCVLIAMATVLSMNVSAIAFIKEPLKFNVAPNAFEPTEEASINADIKPSEYFTTEEDAVNELRRQMVARNTSITIKICNDDISNGTISHQTIDNIYEKALYHTGEPTEGDYILGQILDSSMTAVASILQGGVLYSEIRYDISYVSSASDEESLDAKVSSILSSLNLNGKTDYQKVLAIYDYIRDKVKVATDAETNTYRHSAASAALDNKASAMGIADLFYRLCLEVGVDARIMYGNVNVSESSDGIYSAWNIVSVDGLYYNVDLYREIPRGSDGDYAYFLKGDCSFDSSLREDEFNIAEFYDEYPISLSNYSSASPSSVEAGINGESISSTRYANPLYAGVDDGTDFPEIRKEEAGIMADKDYSSYNTTIEEAASELREGMVARSENIKVTFAGENMSYQIVYRIFAEAFRHTGEGNEGDYLRWHWNKMSAGWEWVIKDGIKYSIINFGFSYYTTAAQESELATEIAKLEKSFDMDKKSDYYIVKTLYDYICSNITYNTAQENNTAYTLKYTAYDALIKKTAVCQGFANLFYRMANDYGVDARITTYDDDNGSGHAFNIVYLSGFYYNLDSTWDAGKTEYDYFLVSDFNFVKKEHLRSILLYPREFMKYYPISAKNYVADLAGDVNDDGKVDSKDLLLLAKFLAGYNIKINGEKADLDGVNGVNGIDLLRLKKIVAGVPVN